MPKQTFFNIEPSKQKAIISSAIEEFSRTNYEDSSIQNIIKSANISRGSFYQYFEDKDDLFIFILKHIGMTKPKFIQILESNEGDLFKSFYTIFEKQYAIFNNYSQLYMNFFFSDFHIIMRARKRHVYKNKYELPELLPLIDRSQFCIEDESTLRHIVHSIFHSIPHIIISTYNLGESKEVALSKFNNVLNVYKNGILKSNI